MLGATGLSSAMEQRANAGKSSGIFGGRVAFVETLHQDFRRLPSWCSE